MLTLRTCIDVDDLDKGIAFYTQAFELKAGRRFRNDWVELLGGPCPIDLIGKPAGSTATPAKDTVRKYDRHWTPVHLDVVVSDLDAAVERCQRAGASVEQPIATKKWGRIAILSDPFGHGFCLLEFLGKGYDLVLSAS